MYGNHPYTRDEFPRFNNAYKKTPLKQEVSVQFLVTVLRYSFTIGHSLNSSNRQIRCMCSREAWTISRSAGPTARAPSERSRRRIGEEGARCIPSKNDGWMCSRNRWYRRGGRRGSSGEECYSEDVCTRRLSHEGSRVERGA